MLAPLVGKLAAEAIGQSDLMDKAKQLVKQKSGTPQKLKGGGVTRGDGCVRKGHTKGKNV